MGEHLGLSRLDRATADEWQRVRDDHVPYRKAAPDRVLALLRQLDSFSGGFAVSQLTHCLQTGTRAERAGGSDEMVLAALCHDVGKAIFLQNHAGIAAEMLRPFVSSEVRAIVAAHQDFEGFYYFGKPTGPYPRRDPRSREKYREEPWYARAIEFSEWDQASFEPDYDTLPLEHFEPLLRKMLSVQNAE